MAIDFYGATITLGGTSVAGSVGGKIVGFTIPADEVKERNDTGLSDAREIYAKMAQSVAREFVFTVRFDPEDQPVAKGDSGTWLITLPKQTTGSVAAMTYSFSGFCKVAGEITGDIGTSEGVTQQFTVRATGEITATPEA